MKELVKCHKNSAILMCLSMLACIWSGKKGDMKIHKYSACIMCLSGLVCMSTGYKMTHRTQKAEQKKGKEEGGNASKQE